MDFGLHTENMKEKHGIAHHGSTYWLHNGRMVRGGTAGLP
jgi:hypothetical protein